MATKDLIKELQDRLALQEELIESLTTELREGKPKADRELIDKEMEVLYDPFDDKNPLTIKMDIQPDDDFPEGQKLGWKSPEIRKRIGMRGWIPVTWDDEYGKNIDKYLANPPEKFLETGQVDNIVRSGDAMLCRLDMRIFRSRMMKMELESMRRRGEYSKPKVQKIREGVTLTGPGLQRNPNPSLGAPERDHTPFDRETGKGSVRTHFDMTNEE